MAPNYATAKITMTGNRLERARQYALDDSKRKHSKIKTPFVIGAIIDLANCFDLLDKKCLDLLAVAYKEMAMTLNEAGKYLPINALFSATDFDFKKREPLYPNAGFKTHNHIQLCIINPDCIKGVFLPRDKQN